MNGMFEHEEEVLFTDPTSKGGNVLAVIDSDLDTSSADSNCECKKEVETEMVTKSAVQIA